MGTAATIGSGTTPAGCCQRGRPRGWWRSAVSMALHDHDGRALAQRGAGARLRGRGLRPGRAEPSSILRRKPAADRPGSTRLAQPRVAAGAAGELTGELRLTVQHCLVRHLGMTAPGAAQWLQGEGDLRIPVDPDSGALVVRDLHHQGLRVVMEARLSGRAGADGTDNAPERRGPH